MGWRWPDWDRLVEGAWAMGAMWVLGMLLTGLVLGVAAVQGARDSLSGHGSGSQTSQAAPYGPNRAPSDRTTPQEAAPVTGELAVPAPDGRQRCQVPSGA